MHCIVDFLVPPMLHTCFHHQFRIAFHFRVVSTSFLVFNNFQIFFCTSFVNLLFYVPPFYTTSLFQRWLFFFALRLPFLLNLLLLSLFFRFSLTRDQKHTPRRKVQQFVSFIFKCDRIAFFRHEECRIFAQNMVSGCYRK